MSLVRDIHYTARGGAMMSCCSSLAMKFAMPIDFHQTFNHTSILYILPPLPPLHYIFVLQLRSTDRWALRIELQRRLFNFVIVHYLRTPMDGQPNNRDMDPAVTEKGHIDPKAPAFVPAAAASSQDHKVKTEDVPAVNSSSNSSDLQSPDGSMS